MKISVGELVLPVRRLDRPKLSWVPTDCRVRVRGWSSAGKWGWCRSSMYQRRIQVSSSGTAHINPDNTLRPLSSPELLNLPEQIQPTKSGLLIQEAVAQPQKTSQTFPLSGRSCAQGLRGHCSSSHIHPSTNRASSVWAQPQNTIAIASPHV